MSVKRISICAVKCAPILLGRICVSVMMATHWALMEALVLVKPLILYTI